MLMLAFSSQTCQTLSKLIKGRHNISWCSLATTRHDSRPTWSACLQRTTVQHEEIGYQSKIYFLS